PPKPSFSNVYLKDTLSNDAQRLTRELRTMVERSQGNLALETLDDLQKRILNTFDNTFRITDALYVLCSIVAVVSAVSCLNLQILLRNREWSLHWALGVGEDVILKRFSWWSALLALLAALASLAGGWILSAVLVYAVNYHSFGYSLSLHIPWQLPLLIVAVATLSGFLSGKLQTFTMKKNISLGSLARE
ncbi:MAG: Macrolide export ATP-binding/permease protein MacB, partial [Pseudomonadota bacterium]